MSTNKPATQTAALGEPLIFVRVEGVYAINSMAGRDLRQQAEDNALLNPGTLRVEDAHGNVLWSLQ